MGLPRRRKSPVTCAVEGCEKLARGAGGLCSGHYHRLRRYGSPTGQPAPRQRVWASDAVCVIDGCEKRRAGKGWCAKHYNRWRVHGDPLVTTRPNYGSGRQRSGEYVHLVKPGHPIADARGRVLEHRFLMWEAGLLTDPDDVVHHLNGVKDDNRKENLEVLDLAEHTRRHLQEQGYVTNQLGRFPTGTHSVAGYKRGCRCGICTKANTDYRRAARARRREREGSWTLNSDTTGVWPPVASLPGG